MKGFKLKYFFSNLREFLRSDASKFLAPALFFVIVFFIIPIIISVYMSFTPLRNWNIDKYAGEFIGLENYYRLFYLLTHDPSVKAVMITTIVFVSITLTINVIGGLALAIGTFFMNEKAAGASQLLWLLPRMTPVAVYSLIWYYFFHPSSIGTLNSILLKLGIIDEPIDLGQQILPWGAWAIIVFVNGLVGVSYGMIIFTSAISNIPKELVIAARVDGASNWDITRKILIPMLKWHITYVTTWQLLSLLTTYDHLFLLVKWGLVNRDYGTTWSLYVYNTAFLTGIQDQGLAAAAGVVLVIVSSILGIITLKLMGFEKMIKPPRGDI
ncbi:carbohydrate ABC transporter permease [Staphylothermus hellenicus]|uniref:Binding-protein-dependent transport systems inner membrane component n=1 Tax=Staphylothermus hellenicus (strain DSM 12710 / JCM 10830 / BK20S6-10-b1 / P8) TaxID=591019 RepID=D7DCD3_STAHD|nr:sugar ABC transporter permease [Staphylothermus hellenicus]ADI31830.1 binding-protein-dependent transport systems inner membrane component [Staphylothermus hellenicus DSM 12710]